MTLFLEVIAGSLKGTRAAIREGFSIGRNKGTLTIRDSKLSGMHVVVEQRDDGSFWLVDAGSSNGIKIGDQRVRELKLQVGVIFTLGRTDFRIITADPTQIRLDLPIPISPEQERLLSQPETEGEREDTVTRNWFHWVQKLAERGQQETKDLPPLETEAAQLKPFDPVLRLRFTRGSQTGTEWTLGYGPRSIGSGSVDLNLDDPTLPAVCFRLIPKARGVVLENETLKEVKVNGTWLVSADLKDGDRIDISGIQIMVLLPKGHE